MGVIYLVAGAAVLGAVLIGLLMMAGQNPATEPGAGTDDETPREGRLIGAEGAWLYDLSLDELRRLLALLFEEIKFEVTPMEEDMEGGVTLIADDPTPIRGVKLLVFGLPPTVRGPVDADVVRRVMEMVRGEEAGKGAVVTTAAFTDDARRAAQTLPVDLVDGTELLRLVRKHLPQVQAQRGL